ncbi:hypothetical protein J4457_00615 [Candidatus Woesearchaeota archaeon]|nr:hypothetical protein [Candidatus Woesearchaeota archaeon]
MIKPSKVVFISNELEKDFNELKRRIQSRGANQGYKGPERKCVLRNSDTEKIIPKRIRPEIWYKQLMEIRPAKWMEIIIYHNSRK